MMPPWYRLLWCSLFGHSFVGAEHPPVIVLMAVCTRCGKVERLR